MLTKLFQENTNISNFIQSDPFLKNLHNEIQEKKLDYTGAQKEQFARQAIGKIFDKTIEYDYRDETWKIKKEYENIYIYTVTLPTLSEINSVSHSEGDKLLKGWLKEVKGEAIIFHKIGADFILITHRSIEIPIEFGKPVQGIPKLITHTKLKIEDLLKIARADMRKPGVEGETSISKKEFTRVVLLETARESEKQKLLATINYFKAKKVDTYENTRKYYDGYVKYLFEGPYHDHIDISTPDWILKEKDKTILDICTKVATLRTIGTVAERKWEKHILKELKSKIKKIDEKDKKTFIKKETEFKTERRSRIEIIENYLENSTQNPFPQNTLRDMLRELDVDEFGFEKSVANGKHLELIAELIMERYILEFDRMTGFRQKEHFNQDILRDIENNLEPTIGIIDLGYLKYFNYLGNRELGDHAIKKAAWLLQQTLLGLKDTDIYRIGGDEFGIKTLETKNINILEKRLSIGVNEIGTIPSNGKTHDLYEEQKLEFNIGYCTYELAQKIYSEVSDLFRGHKDGDKNKRRNRLLMILLIKIADINLENNKAIIRLKTIAKKIKDLQNTEVFEKFLAFSGKALDGIPFEELLKELKDIKIEETDIKIWERLLNKLTKENYHYGNYYSKELVERVITDINSGTI